ncbi:MAG: hypothetical protein AAF065_11890 [Verrucomicrobiota bacterium]
MKKKTTFKDTLTAEQLAGAEIVPAYVHPDSHRSVARHLGDEAYTITGAHCGAINKKAAEDAEKKAKAPAPKKEAEPEEKPEPKPSKS